MKKEAGALQFWYTTRANKVLVARFFLVHALTLVVSACSVSTLTEEEIYEREVARNEAEDEYMMKEMACRDTGGIMVFDYYSTFSRKKRALTVAQMKSSHCERSAADIGRGVF